MLLPVKLSFQSCLLKLMDISELFYLLSESSLKLNSNFLSHLDVFSVSNAVIMKDIDVRNSFGLKVSVKFFTPLSQKLVPSNQCLISLLLPLKLCLQDFLLQLELCLIIIKFGL